VTATNAMFAFNSPTFPRPADFLLAESRVITPAMRLNCATPTEPQIPAGWRTPTAMIGSSTCGCTFSLVCSAQLLAMVPPPRSASAEEIRSQIEAPQHHAGARLGREEGRLLWHPYPGIGGVANRLDAHGPKEHDRGRVALVDGGGHRERV